MNIDAPASAPTTGTSRPHHRQRGNQMQHAGCRRARSPRAPGSPKKPGTATSATAEVSECAAAVVVDRATSQPSAMHQTTMRGRVALGARAARMPPRSAKRAASASASTPSAKPNGCRRSSRSTCGIANTAASASIVHTMASMNQNCQCTFQRESPPKLLTSSTVDEPVAAGEERHGADPDHGRARRPARCSSGCRAIGCGPGHPRAGIGRGCSRRPRAAGARRP